MFNKIYIFNTTYIQYYIYSIYRIINLYGELTILYVKYIYILNRRRLEFITTQAREKLNRLVTENSNCLQHETLFVIAFWNVST